MMTQQDRDTNSPQGNVNTDHLRSGAILIGGAARRLNGAAKGMITHAGKPIISHLLDILKTRCDDVYLVGQERDEYRSLGVHIYPDVIENRGSPGGVYSALCHADHSNVVVLACDMPNITHAFVDTLLSLPLKTHARVYRCEGRVQPLFGLWHQSCAPAFAELFEHAQPGFADILTRLDVDYLDATNPDVFTNLNTPDDVNTWRS